MYSLLKKLLSDKSKHKLFQFFVKIIRKKLVDIESRMPKHTLQQKHIDNLKALENRIKLLEMLPKNGVVAELGVNKGEFSKQILDITQPKKLHLVDGVVHEPIGGAHRNPEEMFKILRKELNKELKELCAMDVKKLTDERLKKFSNMGVFK